MPYIEPASAFTLSFFRLNTEMPRIVRLRHDKEMMKDQIMMQDGKVMMIKKAKSIPVDKEITLSDGTKVTVDGTVTMKTAKR